MKNTLTIRFTICATFIFWGLSAYCQTNIFPPTGNVGIGIIAPQAKLDIKGSGSTLGTYSLNIVNSLNKPLMRLRDDGRIGIGIINPQKTLHIYSKDNLDCGTGIRLEYVFTGPINGCGNSTWDIIANGPQKLNFFNTSLTYPVLTLTGGGKVVIGNASDCNISNLKLIVNGQLFLTDGATEEPRTIYWGSGCQPQWGLEYNSAGHLSTNGGLNFWTPSGSHSGLGNGILFLENITGNIGVGTFTPKEKLDVIGTGRFGNANGYINIGFNSVNSMLDNFGTGSLLINYYSGKDVVVGGKNANNGTFTTNHSTYLAVNDGSVGIGTGNTGSFKLAVEGKVGAREFRVTQTSPWPDFVFDNNFKLLPLKELENYISKNNHLPDMPSAKDIEKEGGIDLGKTQIQHLQKTEELYLYLLQMNNKILDLQKENELLKVQIQKLIEK
ncbi:MAG: hypothetical protein PHD97_10840 [Bacteroidales bacterium]|nr:hypothetical protein [Bacteroidales bacterium]